MGDFLKKDLFLHQSKDYTMETTYGIISDIHAADPQRVITALRILTKQLGVENLILNGDLIGERCPESRPQDNLAAIIGAAVNTGVKVYALEGSHEEIALAQPIFDHYSRQANFFDACQNPVVDGIGHRLLFLPGSDWHAADVRRGVYLIDEQPASLESGFYQTTQGDPLHLTNITDVVKYTRDPKRTIVVS